jgi:hypothetical protein
MALGVDSAPSENEYQEHFLRGKGGRCVRVTTSPPLSAECHGNLGA